MASRSFKPASSYLASQSSKRSPRPPFTRSSSASSTKSEDSFITTLKNLTTADSTSGRERDLTVGSLGSSGAASPRCHTPVTSAPDHHQHQPLDSTPGRKRSQPIAIELPSRNPAVYTPLSARGDLPGGYFPNHETLPKQYKSHPFSQHYQENRARDEKNSPASSPSNMSNPSSAFSSPSETTPKGPQSILPDFQPSLPVPEVLTMPMGKYHPSNYKLASPSVNTAPTSMPMPPTNLSMPSASSSNRKSKPRLGHERLGSDTTRKIQEYKRSLAKQAQIGAAAHLAKGIPKPISPRLLPLGSPGPITPFELEEGGGGYMVAGSRVRAESLDKEQELVGRMIRAEDERRALGGNEGSQSPVMRV